MAVPEDIRKVPRPKDTIVDCVGTSGKNMYPVCVRSSVKYVQNGNPQSHNGKVIGNIKKAASLRRHSIIRTVETVSDTKLY